MKAEVEGLAKPPEPSRAASLGYKIAMIREELRQGERKDEPRLRKL